MLPRPLPLLLSVSVSTLPRRESFDVRLSQRSHESFRLWRPRSLNSTLFCILAAVVGEFNLCKLGRPTTDLVLTGHRRSPDVGG